MEDWAKLSANNFKPDNFNDQGFIPIPASDSPEYLQQTAEYQKDIADISAWEDEQAGNSIEDRMARIIQKESMANTSPADFPLPSAPADCSFPNPALHATPAPEPAMSDNHRGEPVATPSPLGETVTTSSPLGEPARMTGSGGGRGEASAHDLPNPEPKVAPSTVASLAPRSSDRALHSPLQTMEETYGKNWRHSDLTYYEMRGHVSKAEEERRRNILERAERTIKKSILTMIPLPASPANQYYRMSIPPNKPISKMPHSHHTRRDGVPPSPQTMIPLPASPANQ